MNRYLPVLFACALAASSAADPGTAFTYQGRLDNGGVPVQGTVSLRFSLHDAATAGTPVGATIDRIDTTAIDGVVIETLDFGDAFDGGARWLQIEVDADGGSDSFVTLGDRVAILPVPYAVYAENAGTASVALNDAVDDADADPTNELQTLSFASPSLSISGGNSVDLSALVPAIPDGHSLDAADGSPVDAVYVDSDGNVGIGTTTPGAMLDVGGLVLFGQGSGTALDQQQLATNVYFSTGEDIWQSFTAGRSGNLESVEVFVAVTNIGGIHGFSLYEGEGAGGTLLATVVDGRELGKNVWATFTFPTTPAIVAGNTYTVVLDSSSVLAIAVDEDDSYPGGRSSFSSTTDVMFRTYVQVPASAVTFWDGTTQTTAYPGSVDDADADPVNELQTLAFASPNLSISDGNSVDLSSLIPSGADGHSLDASDGSPVDALYVDAHGNVGIGTTSPRYRLDVNEEIAITGGLPELDQANESYNTALVPLGAASNAQTFTPSYDGKLSRIEVLTEDGNSVASGVCYLYSGGSVGTRVLLATATYTLPTGVQEWAAIDFDTFVDVTAGEIYHFMLDPDGDGTHRIRAHSGNPYGRGKWLGSASYDMAFRTYMAGEPGILFADDTYQTTAFTGDVDDADADPTNELQSLASVLGEGNDAGGADVSNLGTVSAAGFSGDGSGLTNISAPSVSSLDASDGDPADVLVVDSVGRVQVGGSGVFVGQFGQLRCEDGGLELATRPIVVDASQASGSYHYVDNADLWQSFTAGLDGQLTGIEVQRSSGAPESAVIVYEGEGTGGTVLSATMIPALPSLGWQLASFTVPVEVTVGTMYTVQLSNGAYWRFGRENPYSGGRSKIEADNDHKFRAYMLDTTGGDEYLPALHVNAADQFVGILNTDPAYPLEVGTNTTNGNGAHVTTGGTWTNGSSRTFKENFAALDPAEILAKVCALPVTGWNYVGSDEGQHIGPMAEDFHAAFGLGDSEKYISTVDADGVAFAAIQGLNELVQEKQAKIDDLEARLAALEAMMGSGASTPAEDGASIP